MSTPTYTYGNVGVRIESSDVYNEGVNRLVVRMYRYENGQWVEKLFVAVEMIIDEANSVFWARNIAIDNITAQDITNGRDVVVEAHDEYGYYQIVRVRLTNNAIGIRVEQHPTQTNTYTTYQKRQFIYTFDPSERILHWYIISGVAAYLKYAAPNSYTSFAPAFPPVLHPTRRFWCMQIGMQSGLPYVKIHPDKGFVFENYDTSNKNMPTDWVVVVFYDDINDLPKIVDEIRSVFVQVKAFSKRYVFYAAWNKHRGLPGYPLSTDYVLNDLDFVKTLSIVNVYHLGDGWQDDQTTTPVIDIQSVVSKAHSLGMGIGIHIYYTAITSVDDLFAQLDAWGFKEGDMIRIGYILGNDTEANIVQKLRQIVEYAYQRGILVSAHELRACGLEFEYENYTTTTPVRMEALKTDIGDDRKYHGESLALAPLINPPQFNDEDGADLNGLWFEESVSDVSNVPVMTTKAFTIAQAILNARGVLQVGLQWTQTEYNENKNVADILLKMFDKLRNATLRVIETDYSTYGLYVLEAEGIKVTVLIGKTNIEKTVNRDTNYQIAYVIRSDLTVEDVSNSSSVTLSISTSNPSPADPSTNYGDAQILIEMTPEEQPTPTPTPTPINLEWCYNLARMQILAEITKVFRGQTPDISKGIQTMIMCKMLEVIMTKLPS